MGFGTLIGRSAVKWDAVDKARGAFVFPSDMTRPGMVHVKVVRADRPHARIRYIDTSRAEAVDGVVCVLTHHDVPGLNAFGLMTADQPVLCVDRVRFAGDAVTVVAAETESAARRAKALVSVEYEDLPPLLDPRAALSHRAPQIHEGGNLCHRTRMGFGDVDAALAGSAHISRVSYVTGRQEHAYLEPEAGISYIDSEGRLAIVCGGQNPFADRKQLAAILAVPEEKVWVSHPPMGGAFGGKEDLNVQAPLALVTSITGRPARMVYDRSESLAHSVKRHRFEVSVEVGADSDGTLTGFRADILADTGAYLTLGPGVLVLAAEHAAGPYCFAASEIIGRVVYTNNSNASAFRGFGNPQIILGIEQAMDELATKLAMNPIELRCRNLLRKGNLTGAGHMISSDTSLGHLAELAQASDLNAADDRKGSVHRATGVAFAWQGFGLGSGAEPGSTVRLSRDLDGGFTLNLSQPDLGQGNLSAFLQIAANELHCPLSEIRLDHGSTDHANAWSTNASRSVAVTGSAVWKAARAVRKRMDAGENGLLSEEAYFVPDMGAPLEKGAPHVGYAYAIQLVRLALDTVTGTVDIEAAETYLDPGTVISPDGVTGQIEGGFAQGLGFALSEELSLENGRVLNDRFSSYIIPTIRDVPPHLHTVLHSIPEPSNPVGTRGVAEIGLTPVAAAVANGLTRLTGHRFPRFPILPEHIADLLEDIA